MKTTALLSLIIIICTLFGNQESYAQIDGAWRLVYLKSYRGDSLQYEFPSEKITINQVKMWSKDHFMFVGQYVSESSTENSYGEGTFTLKGTRYEEQILHHSTPEWVGTSIKMRLEINKDTLIQIFPVNEEGELVTDWHIIEKYIRY